jgi:hypothetical protein
MKQKTVPGKAPAEQVLKDILLIGVAFDPRSAPKADPTS